MASTVTGIASALLGLGGIHLMLHGSPWQGLGGAVLLLLAGLGMQVAEGLSRAE